MNVQKNVQKKVVSVVGPTATGKTKRALKIARKAIADGWSAGVDLISVDSRQVYQGLEILTGADVPEGFEKKNWKMLNQVQHDRAGDNSEILKQVQDDEVAVQDGGVEVQDDEVSLHVRHDGEGQYFANADESIRIFGISIIQPKEEWSVAHFQEYARAILTDSWQHNRLPILVGGTGLYHQELFRQDETLHVSPNQAVRQQAEKMNLEELQNLLKKIDHDRFERMNHSDQNNSRRLIRAIEVGLAHSRSSKAELLKGKTLKQVRGDEAGAKSEILKQVQGDEADGKGDEVGAKSEILNQVQDDADRVQHDKVTTIDWSSIQPEIIMVNAPLAVIRKKIEKRVTERFESGAIEEVKWLLSLDLSPSLPVFSTLGVPEITQFLQGKITAEECQKLWSLHEFQYAKRQLTWWKKHY